jgi:uncharacterized membrane protein YqaE (UPF0057 family)
MIISTVFVKGLLSPYLNNSAMKRMYTRLLVFMMAFSMITSPLFAINVVNPTVKDETLPSTVTVKQAVAEFKSLNKKEKKQRFKQVKKAIKEFKASKAAGTEPSTNTLLLVLLALLLPPLAVYLHEGVINNKFWISLILTLLFWIPGVIYALIVVLS